MERDQALGMLQDGHAVYSVEAGKSILEALGVPWDDELAFEAYSEPGVFKGLIMNPGNEGALCVSALGLGSYACDYFNLKTQSYMGRGFQAQEYVSKLKMHFLLGKS